VTRSFAGGYVRLYAKLLDDRSPFYDWVPLRVTGTADKPGLVAVAGFDPTRDTLSTSYLQSVTMLDENNNPVTEDLRQGQRVKEKALGLEAQVDLDGWTVTDRFRVASRSGGLYGPFSSALFTAQAGLTRLGGAGATLSYATGPNAGQVITDPAALNGNGLIAVLNLRVRPQEDLGSLVNDLRASKIYRVGQGDLTLTGGFYASRQAIHTALRWAEAVSEVRGDGQAALLNVTNAGGQAVTQNGIYAYNYALNNGTQRRTMSVDYAVQALYGSANYHIGRLAVGAACAMISAARGAGHGVGPGRRPDRHDQPRHERRRGDFPAGTEGRLYAGEQPGAGALRLSLSLVVGWGELSRGRTVLGLCPLQPWRPRQCRSPAVHLGDQSGRWLAGHSPGGL
jgi:hypothetical protein